MPSATTVPRGRLAGTVDTDFPDGYAYPSYFDEYPAHGNPGLNQDYYLAPFLDFDGDGSYNPAAGDYPWFDFLQEIDCGNRRREDLVPLYGDQNYYWILNDKGNVHSESQGEPMMEIRAQALRFRPTTRSTTCRFTTTSSSTKERKR